MASGTLSSGTLFTVPRVASIASARADIVTPKSIFVTATSAFAESGSVPKSTSAHPVSAGQPVHRRLSPGREQEGIYTPSCAASPDRNKSFKTIFDIANRAVAGRYAVTIIPARQNSNFLPWVDATSPHLITSSFFIRGTESLFNCGVRQLNSTAPRLRKRHPPLTRPDIICQEN